jgi:FMN-dependent NADH-azoreductase
MKITAITGTAVNGCTRAMMDLFLEGFRKDGAQIVSFTLPKDAPPYCMGCKTCFFQGEDKCPHADKVLPIWNAMLAADLIVLAYPVYALRAPAQVKALLDHLCVHWFVHRPDPGMFQKRAVILTQAIGIFYRAAIKDVSTSLSWLGVSDIRALGAGLLEGVYWNELSGKRRGRITRRIQRLAARYKTERTPRMSLLVRMKFFLTMQMHRMFSKKQETLSRDDQYWADTFFLKAR